MSDNTLHGREKLYETIRTTIAEQLEAGVAPWRKSWAVREGGCLPLRANGEHYKGVNVPLLWIAQAMRGFASNRWITYRQAQELGGNVKGGSKAAMVIKYGLYEREDKQTGEKETGAYLKTYSVFNTDECEGLPSSFLPKPIEVISNPDKRDAGADAFFAGTGAQIGHGGDRAYYIPSADRIQMPDFGQFDSAVAYYGTLAHECTHWTGHDSRCARKFGSSMQNESYAFEELIAEFGAAFVMGSLELEPTPREDHAAYLKSWGAMLKQKPKAFLEAAAAAQRASDYLHSLQSSTLAIAA